MSDAQQVENVEPTFIPYTPEDVEVSNVKRKSKVLAEGTYKGRVIQAERSGTAGTGTMFVPFTIAPLDEDERQRAPVLKHRLYIPKANPDVADHKAPRTFGFWKSYLQATRPTDFPRWPRRVNDSYLDLDDNKLTSAEYEAACVELKTAIYKEIDRIQQEPTVLLDDEFYFTVRHKAGKNNRTYPEIARLYGEGWTGLEDQEILVSGFSDE